MASAAPEFLSGWSPGFWSVLGLGLALGVYLRGWNRLRRTVPARFPGWRAAAFAGGLLSVAVAEWSPLEVWSDFLLSAHMVQHLLLVLVAAPLLLLGSPWLPLLSGLPRPVVRETLAPFLNAPELRWLGHRLTHPLTGWLALTLGLLVWHVPAAFEAALRSPFWHGVEHATFFLGALLFWWPVVRPFPSHPVWPRWTVPLYLLAADLVNSALAAVLTFSERVLYPTYATVPRLFGTTALGDQSLAGILMWVPGSLVFLIPAALTAVDWLSPELSPAVPVTAGNPRVAATRVGSPSAGTDDHRHRVGRLGAFLAKLGVRRGFQAAAVGLAGWVVVDGFTGPRDAASNAAGALAWNGVRALALLGLLTVGNVFCFACPFMLPRELARRMGGVRRAWPRVLRGKWLAVGLLMAFFWAYEAWDLWNRPAATAALVLGYFTTCLVVDSLFQDASFCRHVCPIGQFTMVSSLASPAEVTVRSPETCAHCTTHDCLRGNARTGARGCELGLLLPRKAGGLDCTFCLDCARACPHDNVTLKFGSPVRSLVGDTVRSGVGRLSARTDVAVLALVVVLGGVSGAAVMTAPVSEWISSGSAGSDRGVRTALLQWGIAGGLPAAVLGLALRFGRWWSGSRVAFRTLACRLILATLPVGLALWTGHLVGHLVLSGTGDWTGRWLPEPIRQAMTSAGLGEAVLSFQTLLLGLGWLLSLHAGWQVSGDIVKSPRGALRLFLPWGAWTGALYAAGLWCLVQPMPLRGVVNFPRP